MSNLNKIFFLVSLLSLAPITGCGGGDCTIEDCSAWGGPAGRTFEGCVEGIDFVLYDSRGDEISRCTTNYVGIEDKNDCGTKHAAAKATYCNL
jgi:hypothetical protein